ncbi:MAG: alkane 1-monooxygenase [Marinicellaceae bacterium]
MSKIYKDKKKYLWLLSSLMPLVASLGPYLYIQTGLSYLIFVPLIIIYAVIPLLDLIFSEDLSNPPEEVVPSLEKNNYYRIVTYLMLPVHFFSLYYIVNFIVTTPLPIWMVATQIITLGVFGGLAVNLGHEMGHKKSKLDRNLAKFALASSGYGHFNIEHNAGHHRDVATPKDTASSKFGENIYRFTLREIPGGFKRAWKIENNRLNKQGKSFWSIDNQILHSYLMTACIFLFFTYTMGYYALIILLLHSPITWWQLTTANYIEHYGLLRQKNAQGKYERCQPKHSWNSNHLMSNLVLFHLQRHADHHANPSRHYQSLRDFPEAPQLPMGYMGMFVLAYIPPLWRKFMDPKVLKLANNNFDHINSL